MKSLFQALANAADGAFVIDQEQQVTYWNQAAQEMLGYAGDEVIGRPCYEILAGQDHQGRLVCCENCRVAITAFFGGTVMTYDSYVRTKSGDGCWVNMSTLTYSVENNGASLVLVHLFRKTTQKKRNEQFIDQVLRATKNLQSRERLRAVTPSTLTEHRIKDLTNREREVLTLLAQGFSTREIAQTLSISPATVRNHIRTILQKLQVRSRVEAVVYALGHGLVSKD